MTGLSRQLLLAAASLQLYRGLLLKPIGRAWLECMQVLTDTVEVDAAPRLDVQINLLNHYGRWFQHVAGSGMGWSDWLLSEILVDDNPLSRLASQQTFKSMPVALRIAAKQDLQRLLVIASAAEEMARTVEALTSESVAIADSSIASPNHTHLHLAGLFQSTESWAECLEPLAAHYLQSGVGLFGRCRAARWQAKQLVGVQIPDGSLLDRIYGYERQKVALRGNVEALLQRQPCLNVLLYGARGTGKSSLVKALLAEYGDRGLRIVELSRSDLQDLLVVVDQLSQLPQSFILFIDDLSFSAEETDYKQLKVMLEGDIAARPANVCLYATSNRRHLVKEYLSDRPSPSDDEVHAWDSVQEKLSLSDRFGLTLTFPPFSQADYFATVYHLAELRDLNHSRDELRQWSLTWAQQQNGFSGRTARQFIDRLQGQKNNLELLARGF